MASPIPSIASASDDEITLWEPDGGDSPLTTFEPHSDQITCVRWTSSDRVLASGAKDGTVALTEASGALFHTLEAASPTGATVAVLCITWSPGSRYLAAGGSDAVVRVFDLQKRSQALTLRGHRAAVRGVAWSPSEVYVASSSDAGEIVVHRVQGSVAAVAKVEHPPSLVAADAGAPPAVGSIQWSPFHPSLLAAGASDGTLGIWNIRPGTSPPPPAHVFSEHSTSCTGLQWSPVNQHLLASCSSDASLIFYDATKKSVVRVIRLQRAITAMAFASSGVHCAAGTGGGELHVFDLRRESETPTWSVQAHHGAIRSLAFQRASTTVASANTGSSPVPLTMANGKPSPAVLGPHAASKIPPPSGGDGMTPASRRAQPRSGRFEEDDATARELQLDDNDEEEEGEELYGEEEMEEGEGGQYEDGDEFDEGGEEDDDEEFDLAEAEALAAGAEDEEEEEEHVDDGAAGNEYYSSPALGGGGGGGGGGQRSRIAIADSPLRGSGARAAVRSRINGSLKENTGNDAPAGGGGGVPSWLPTRFSKAAATQSPVQAAATPERSPTCSSGAAPSAADRRPKSAPQLPPSVGDDAGGHAATRPSTGSGARTAATSGGGFGNGVGQIASATLPPPRAVWAEAPGSVELKSKPPAAVVQQQQQQPPAVQQQPPQPTPPRTPPLPPPPQASAAVAAARPAETSRPVVPPSGGRVGSAVVEEAVAAATAAASAAASAAVAPHLEAFLYDVRSALQEDLRGLHLEMLRELEAQRHEMRCLLLDESREVVSLRRENEELRRRMEEMRGPMGGLAQWAEEEEGA